MMTVEEVSADLYKGAVRVPYHVFGGAAFNKLNESKAESVYYLLFKDTKNRVAISGGVTGGVFSSPFSAPFGAFIPLSADLRLPFLEESIDALETWAREKKISKIKLTLPPAVYDNTFIAKQVNSLYRKQFTIGNIELNHHFDLSRLGPGYLESIWHNARKNLKASLASNLSFRRCESVDEQAAAYEVIRRNREARGFPLRMTWEQVHATSQVVPADFFLAADATGTDIAAAVVFTVADKVVQVIYWGDLPEYAHLRTMNFLSYSVFEYYKKNNYRIVDIGPSTENSVPNYGLCEFKESIGCEVTSKFTFIKAL
ncbi:hypothetical protein KK083_26855 [Fulvivirgaceae bacterium PWU4]|uniref:Uncharacterized protein n=1 Tax=Chryseosolibacter histidini TaxID=2782349 RepID=A0AAP2GSC4_9BACT|nr:hypothetical protein [Chryseosolibacter histidini]MBT1700537.1 hypothetical protein [Chryseosolibacter histidini]